MKNKIFIFSRVFCLFILMIFISSFQHLNSQVSREVIKSQIDKEPGNFQLPYSPADGSIVKVNPPPFIWMPVNGQYYNVYHRWVPLGKFTYTLQISGDKDFSSGVITRKGLDYNTYALEEPLEPGEWYWRYGVGRDDINYEGITLEGYLFYSKVRKFVVPSNTKKWSLPDIKEIINKVPQKHPRLFIHSDDVESYRERAKNGDLKEICSAIMKECEKSIGEELIAEPPYRYGVGPEQGKLSQQIMGSTRRPMDIMEQCGLAYLLTGDKKFGEETKRRILHFFSWEPYGPSSYESYDEPAMWVMMRGIRAYDWTYDLFSPIERENVEKVMKIRASQFYDHLRHRQQYQINPYESHANRTLGFLGEACLCFAHEWDEAEDWLKYVLTMYWNIFPVWGKEDGGWHEGPGYWNSYMSFALHFIIALKKATGIDLMEKNFFHNTPYYSLYTNPPYAKMSPFGDGESGPPSKGRGQLMYQFSTLLNDPYIRWYADFMDAGSGSNILGVVLKNDKIKSKSPSDLPQSRYFPGVGLVSIHTDLGNADEDIHFLFHSDPYGPVSHAHADQNAFTLEAFGEALAIASGYYPWYGSDHHNKWQWETKSSNSITFDGWIGQIKRNSASKGEIVKFENHGIYDYVLGDATQAYQGLLKKFERHIVHIRPGIFVIFDDLEAPKPVTFEWWLHALSEMNVDENKNSIRILQGDARLKVLLLQSEKLNLNQFKGFPDPPEHGEEDQWHVTASTSSKRTASKFITVLIPFKRDKEPELSVDNLIEKPKEVSLELSIKDKKYFISFMPEVTVREVGF